MCCEYSEGEKEEGASEEGWGAKRSGADDTPTAARLPPFSGTDGTQADTTGTGETGAAVAVAAATVIDAADDDDDGDDGTREEVEGRIGGGGGGGGVVAPAAVIAAAGVAAVAVAPAAAGRSSSSPSFEPCVLTSHTLYSASSRAYRVLSCSRSHSIKNKNKKQGSPDHAKPKKQNRTRASSKIIYHLVYNRANRQAAAAHTQEKLQ